MSFKPVKVSLHFVFQKFVKIHLYKKKAIKLIPNRSTENVYMLLLCSHIVIIVQSLMVNGLAKRCQHLSKVA